MSDAQLVHRGMLTGNPQPPLFYRLGHWLTRRWRERKLVEARREIDPEHFRRVKRYLFLLFRVLPNRS